jgi:arsenate reductase
LRGICLPVYAVAAATFGLANRRDGCVSTTEARTKVIFACVHNAGRSQMAAAFFNLLADGHLAHAISAGTQPGERVQPEVVGAMREVGIDLANAKPQRVTSELTRGASLLVTMGCGEECPAVPGAERDDWPIEDPKGLPLERVRVIRDEIRRRVGELIAARRWAPANDSNR